MNVLGRIPDTSRAQQPVTAARLAVQAALQVALAAILSAAVVLLGAAGMSVSTAPRWVSLTLEPLCFLLTPGAVFAYADAMYNQLDFSSAAVIHISLLFYFFVFTILLLGRLKPAVQALLPPPRRRSR